MSDNFREFDLGLRDFTEREIPDQVRDFRDAVALEGLRGMVLLTDVDTGRARGNYQTTTGAPATGFDEERFDKAGSATIAAGAAVIAGAADPYAPVWIHNGVPYVIHLNNGTERMAARHMLEQTVARLKRAFSNWRGN